MLECEQKCSRCIGMGLVEEDHVGVRDELRSWDVKANTFNLETGENTHCPNPLIHRAPDVYSKHAL